MIKKKKTYLVFILMNDKTFNSKVFETSYFSKFSGVTGKLQAGGS